MDIFAQVLVGQSTMVPWSTILMIVLGLGILSAAILVAVLLLISRKARSERARNPNLTPCPDCGRYVSRVAPNCPQCGRPITPQQGT